MPIRAQLFDGTVLEFPDGTDQSVIDRVARQETLKRQPAPAPAPAPIEPPKREGFGAAFGKGLESLISPSRTAIGAVTGSAEEAALAGLKRAEASPYAEQVSLEKVKEAYQRGLLPAAGEVLRQIPLAITEQLPNIAATLGSARLGAMAGAPLGPYGAIGGGILGAVAPSLLQQFGGNIQRQAQEQLAAKQPVDISRTAAIAAAVPQAGLDVAATLIPLGRTVAGSVLGPQVKQLLEAGAKESAEKLARESLPTVLAKGAGISIASEAPTEAVQSMLERAQAGLPLLSEDALKEYGEAAYQAALIAPIGAAARVGERSAARQQPLMEGMLPGETERQAAERLQAEILAMKQAAQPPAPPSPGPILSTNNLYNLMAQPNGYGLVEQYKQRLMAMPEQTPEIKQAIEDAAFAQRRSVIEAAERRTPRAPVEEPQRGEDVREAVTEPSGAGVPLVGEPDTGAAAEGVGAAVPGGVVPAVEDAGQPAGGAKAQPLAIAAPAVTPKVEALQGSETRLILPDGDKRSANWEVIEADSVAAAMVEGRAQPRDRQRAASDAQVKAIAQNPDFDRLSDTSQTMDYGAPTLTSDYVIVGGNGRFEGVNLSYNTEAGQAYKQNLINNAQRLGLDPAQVSGMKKPILIRKIPSESVKPEDTRKLAIQSNIVPGLEMSDMERAALDSERMTNLQELDITDTGDIPLTTKNMGTIRDALKGYTKEELSGMLAADGSLSQSGLRRVKNAVLYKAYGKTDTLARLLESPDADLKNVGTALMRASGSMSRLMDGIRSGAIPADYDIIADLTGAVETLSALRASDTKVQDFINQSDMFGDGISNEAKTILTFLDQNLRSAKSITEFLNDYANAAISAESAGDGLFGEVQLPSKQETIERAAQRPEAERAAAQAQQTIFEQPAGTPAEEGAAKPEGAERPPEGGEGEVAKKSLVEMRKRYEAARAAPAEAPVETKPEPTALDKEIEAKIDQLGKVLSRIMGRFGLKDVALRLVEDMRAEGEYAQSVVRLALDAASPVQALRHESIHALKELGFFTPQQWSVLEKQAKSKWVDQYLKNVNINKEPLSPGEKSRYDAYMDLYKGDMDAIIEEAIADAFADFDVNKAPPGMMQAILTRLRNFFDAVKTAFGGEITAEQVFRKVEKGELKAEAAPAETGVKASLRTVPLSTRGLMEVQPIVAMQELGLKTDAVRKPGGIELFNDVRSIALALNQDTIRNHGQIAKTDTSLTSEKELARAMVDEIGYQLRATADTGTGKGWYSDNYPKAVKKLGKLFPELETNPYARTVFSALVAITSNGEKVSLNVKNAIKLYEDIRMGKDPRDIGSRRQKALDNNLAVVLQLMKQYGPTGMRNELLREITVKDMNAILRSRGEKADTSYLADTKVPAAALYFGPKLGAFFSNLEGAEGYLTMDMWWTRTVNRMRGQLESKATEASIKKFANMMDKPNATREEVVAATIPLRNKYEEFGWHTELEELVGKKEPAEDKDKPAWTAKAKRKAGPAYEALLFEHRLEKMANTIYKNEYELLEEAPFTSTDREFMYRTARRAQSLLKAEGINLSLADIQAALWYYEKRLYQHLSGRKADDIGYDEAITQLARESTGPARPSVVFGGQPVSGAGPAGAGAAATGVSGKPSKPSLRSTSAAEAFDQKEIDNLRRPDYKGREKLIEMPISDFLNLADDETDTQKLNVARQRLAQGKQFTTLPYLQVGLDYRVDGHEGRHRAKALMEKGYTSMPVILRMGGLRWDQQSDPNSFDYVKDWPQTLQAQSKAENPDLLVPFPVAREDSVKPYTAPMPKFSLRSSVPRDIHNRIVQTTVAREEKGFVQRITEAISPQSFSSFRAAALNRYNQLSVYDKRLAAQMGGTALLADSSAEAAALLSDLGAGLTASALGVHDRMGGVPVYKNGVTIISNLNNTVKGPTAIFAPLAKYNDPYAYQAYQFWAGVKRGSRFMADGREQLFEPADIQRAEALRKQFLRDGVDFDAIQKEWIKYNNGLVDYMVATGVLSKDRADLYKKHADYLPFYRQMDGEETVGPKIFQAISGVKPPKKLKGGTTPIDDFLENIVRNTQAAIQAGVKNVAAQRAADVAMKIGMATRLPHQSSGPTTFQVLENGKVVTYASNDMLFINAIKSLGLPDLPFIGMLSAPANLLRNLVTKDPGFMLANLMRDSMSAWVTSGVKMTPMVDTISNFGSALVGKNPEFQALMNAGILGGYEFSQNVEQSGREFGKALRKQAGVRAPGYKGVLEMGAKPFTSLWEALEKGSTASDAATRMEVYKKTLAETGNEAEALYRALEVMNFNRKGSSAVIRVLTAAVPFLNARMQGLDVLYRAAFGKMNAADAKEVQRRFFVRGATIMALSAAYWLLTHDDDEYKKQEQETRDNYWLLPSLGVKIPIPFEIGVLFKVIPERFLAYTFGSDTGEDFIKSMARQLTSTLAFNPIPQTALPVVEAMTNFSFFTMRPIVGQGLEGVQPAYQVGPGTSRLAEAIGSATKGLATELQISPMKLDQLINGYTGTMGMYLVNLMDAVYDMNTDSPKPSMRFERMPLIRRFALDPEARGSVTAYYELKNSVDSIVRTSNMLERTMNYEELPGYLQDNMRMLAAKDYLLDLEKTMKEFREMKIMIRSSKMEADAKRDAILSVDQMENQLTANIQYLKSLAKGG